MTAAGALTDEQRSVCNSDAPLYIQWVELLVDQLSKPEDRYSSVLQNAFVKSADLCEEFAQIGSPEELPTAEGSPNRKDIPTDAEIEQGRQVLEAMPTNNPSITAFREACRGKGVKVANAKHSKILKAIKE